MGREGIYIPLLSIYSIFNTKTLNRANQDKCLRMRTGASADLELVKRLKVQVHEEEGIREGEAQRNDPEARHESSGLIFIIFWDVDYNVVEMQGSASTSRGAQTREGHFAACIIGCCGLSV